MEPTLREGFQRSLLNLHGMTPSCSEMCAAQRGRLTLTHTLIRWHMDTKSLLAPPAHRWLPRLNQTLTLVTMILRSGGYSYGVFRAMSTWCVGQKSSSKFVETRVSWKMLLALAMTSHSLPAEERKAATWEGHFRGRPAVCLWSWEGASSFICPALSP